MTPEPSESRRRNTALSTERFDREAFVEMLASHGLRAAEEREENGDHVVVLVLEQGRYKVQVGFPRFDLDDERQFYGNNLPESQGRALEVDHDASEFIALFDEFSELLESSGNGPSWEIDRHVVETLMQSLDDVVQAHIDSSLDDEDIYRMSDILRARKSACSGKALVAGMLLEKLATTNRALEGVEVNSIVGASSRIEEQGAHKTYHEWLRIRFGDFVALYDPYYQRIAVYDLRNPQPERETPFADYDVYAGFVGNLHSDAPMTSIGGVRLVQSIHGTTEPFIDPEQAHLSQITGIRYAQFTTEGGRMTLKDGGFELSKDSDDGASGRRLEPLLDLQRT